MSNTPSTSKSPNEGKQAPFRQEHRRRLTTIALVLVAIGIIIGPNLTSSTKATKLNYSRFLRNAEAHQVTSVTVDNRTGTINGVLSDGRR